MFIYIFTLKTVLKTCGAKFFAELTWTAGMMPLGSAPLVDAYRNANGIILAKMRMHELSAGATSISPTTANFTAVLNPYNVTHHPGGMPCTFQPTCHPPDWSVLGLAGLTSSCI